MNAWAGEAGGWHRADFGEVAFGEQILGLPARAAFEVAASAWCADGAAAFQPAEYPGLKDLLFLHVVPKMLMRRKDPLVVSTLDRAKSCSSISHFCHRFAVCLGGITEFP